MTAQPGEENVATLFADVHYFYSPTNIKPRHHRFDEGSYVYLFENANDGRCRIEVANKPGTDDQDAFDGFLDQSHVRYSYRQHCKVSLTVAETVNPGEWHLPTYDQKNENKYHYKLHSLNIYFWTQQDALMFVSGVRRVLPSSQVEIMDEPGTSAAGINTVVEKLESAAISDPSYGYTGPSLLSSTTEAKESEPSVATSTFPNGIPPPPPPPSNTAPMAYNPAAPAAPETIMHREKTPPPEEDMLNPLAVAVAYDYQKQPFTPGFPPQSQFPLGLASPGLPPNNLGSPGFAPPSFAGHPRQPGLQRSATMPANSSLAPAGLNNQHIGYASSPPPPPPQPSSSISVPSHTQGASPAPAAAPSNYTFSPQSSTHHGTQDYSLHHQLYRPSESDSKTHQYQPKQEARGRLEENAGRLERGVSGMLKKFEKKFG